MIIMKEHDDMKFKWNGWGIGGVVGLGVMWDGNDLEWVLMYEILKTNNKNKCAKSSWQPCSLAGAQPLSYGAALT